MASEANEQFTHIIHRSSEPVLIVEDILENQILLKNLCKHLDLETMIAENGQEALDLSRKHRFSIFIVDLMLPIMDGQTFIRELKKIHPESVILIQSALDSSDTIINVMKLGVFDYIVKPIDPEIFQKTMGKALEFKHLKDREQSLSENAGLRLRNQLEWLNYKETRRKTAQDSAELLSIENLKISLSQGAGVGSMVTIVDLIESMMKPDESGENVVIPKSLTDMLIQNNSFIRALLDGLHAISEIMQKELKLKKTNSLEVIEKLPELLKPVVPYFDEKRIKLSFPSIKKSFNLNINEERLFQAIEELAINAYKYTPTGGHVDIFSYTTEGYLCISVKNDIQENPYGGIPPEYENLVKEPFFRLLPPVETIAGIEKFGLGLGLTVVDHIAVKHHGMFFIHDIKDHTGPAIRNCVIAEIFLPIETQ